MRELMRNVGEFAGEITGLKPKNWSDVKAQHFIETKDGLRRAIGWATMYAVKRGDHETARLETKLFLHDLANPEVNVVDASVRQQAAQELLDEIHGAVAQV